MAQFLGHMLPEGKVLLQSEPTENHIPANSESIAVELVDGTKVSSERAVRWFDVRAQKYVYQVELPDETK